MDKILELVLICKDLAIAFAAVVGTIQGWKALKQWRLEMRGGDQYNVAKEVALKVIELAESLHSVRASWDWNQKYEELYRSKIENKEPESYRKKEYLRFQAKIDIAHNHWVELKKLSFLARVLKIEIPKDMIVEFFEIRGTLAASAYNVYRERSNLNEKANIELNKRREIIHGDKDDEFGKRIEAAKENILEVMEEYL